MVDIKKLFDTLKELETEFIKHWENVGNLESPTEYKAGVDAVGKYFCDYAKKMDWDIEIFPQTAAGDCVCITMNKCADKSPITLSGHIDTVHPVGSFGNPPVKIEGDIMHGPGVMDCKGGTVAALMAMTALHKCGFSDRPIRLLLETDEECNSILSNKATINYICEKAADSVAFLNCESTRDDTLVLWRKGVCRYRLEVTGKSIHASRSAEGGASAILEAAHKIIELEKMKDKDGIICVCGIVNGGQNENTVPDRCVFSAETRFATVEEMEEAEKRVIDIANKTFVEGTSCTVTKTVSRPAMEKSERNFMLLETLNGIYEKCGLSTLTARGSLGGSDAAEVTVAGIPCVDSIGVAGEHIHTPNEFARVSSLIEAARRIATACAYI